jgi:hypothetical protein
VGWSGDVSGSTNPLDVTMTAHKSITATFAINTYTLGVTVVGSGSVARNPDQGAYPHGTLVQLTAAPASGHHFMGWSGDLSGTANPIVVVMSADKTVTATFASVAPPAITSIEDVLNDQGRRVRIQWTRSMADAAYDPVPVTHYTIWRRIDPLPSLRAPGAQGPRRVRTTAYPPGAWDFVSDVPARGEPYYSTVAPTLADSTSDGTYYSVFFVSAVTDNPFLYYDSVPDSGYSVDNLAPAVPTGLAVQYVAGVGNRLAWDDPVDEDFRYFRVYRGTEPDFTPGPGNLVHATVATSWTDAPVGPAFYKLTAVDFAGNESDPAAVAQWVGRAAPGVPAAFALHPPAPNPARGATRLRYDVPAPGGALALGVYDVTGRRVRALWNGLQTAGSHALWWDGRDDLGHTLPAGIYLVRLHAPRFAQTARLLLMQ